MNIRRNRGKGGDDSHFSHQMTEKEKKEKREEDKLPLWMQAWKIYKGEFLPDMIGEQWVAVENVRCRDEYFRVTKELCR